MIPITQFAAAEPSADKISKTDWIDLALAVERTPDGKLDPAALAAWPAVSAAAERFKLRRELVVFGPGHPHEPLKWAKLGADRLFFYETGASFTPVDALSAFSEDYKPAVLTFPNALRSTAEALAAALKLSVAIDWTEPIELDRKKDLVSEIDGLSAVTVSRPQLLVFAAGFNAVPAAAGETETPEIFFCYP